MDSDAVNEPARPSAPLAAPPTIPWYRWGGIGLKRSVDDVTFLEVLAILMVGFTVWGYADIWKRGRVDAARPELHRTDFTVFTGAGAAFFDGRDPYETRNPRGWYYLYPPLFALLVAPLAQLDDPSQVVTWYVISLLLGLGCYLELRRLWRWIRTDVPGIGGHPGLSQAIIAAATVVLPGLECLQRGQLGIALLYPLLVGSRLVLEGGSAGRVAVGGVVLAFPVAIKLVPALPVGCLVVWSIAAALARRRPTEVRRAGALGAGLVLGAGLFLLVVPSLLVGWSAHSRHLETWYSKVVQNREVGRQHGFHIDSASNQSLANALYLYSAQVRGTTVDRSAYRHWLLADTEVARRRAADETTRFNGYLLRGLLFGLLVLAAVRVGVGSERDSEAMVLALGNLGIVALSPLAWSHYYVAWLPAILVVPAWLIRRGRHRSALAMGLVPVVLTWACYVGPARLASWGLLGLGSSGWLLVSLIWLLRELPVVGRAPDLDRADRAFAATQQRVRRAHRATLRPSAAER